MKIVAFLQNPWFRPGTRQSHIERYRDDQRFHRFVLEMSMTGRRLRTAFGDLYDEIHWDNTNWRPASYAAGIIAPDPVHILSVLLKVEPELILTFGKNAEHAILGDTALLHFKVMCCHHPNARHRTQANLNDFAFKVRQWTPTRPR